MKERRSWFDSQLGDARCTCPCCGYPTLAERGGFELCPLCDWEDDGQDDADADQVPGGPNHDYSLTEARANFAEYRTMYCPERDPRIVWAADSPAEIDAKRAAAQAFDEMYSSRNLDRNELWAKVEQAIRVLDSETKRKIAEYESRLSEE